MRTDIVGTVGTPFEMDIERGKIREFAQATHAELPAYVSDDHPIIPPTFLTVADLWQGDGCNPLAGAELDLTRALHAEQEFIFHGPPPRAGMALTAQSRIAAAYEKQGRRGGSMTFVSVVTEFWDASGDVVAEAIWTEVQTGRPPTGAEDP